MLKSRSGSSSASSAEKIFDGVRFVLFGFDSVSEAQYRSELGRRGGVDVGRYDPSCTHVIVSGRVYDDPVCVAAKQDGKTLVTELWIDDCVDFGALADAARILYRPVRDLNGIPGSESLYICLTGYQRQERDDIMKMVSLMGARFSKPLIANQVTHLICYKFEGEKYELAKKVKIKLVNHRWLVDCLKAWEIVPIDNYTKSGWELEVLEAEARDSEDETEDPNTELLGHRSAAGAHVQDEPPVPSSSHVYTPDKGISNIYHDTSAANLSHAVESLLTNQKKSSSPSKETSLLKAEGTAQTTDHQDQDAIEHVNLQKEENGLLSDIPDTKTGSKSSRLGKRCSILTYSKKTPMKEAVRGEASNSFRSGLIENNFNGDLIASLAEARTNCKDDHFQNPTASSGLPQKRKVSELSTGSKSPKLKDQESKISPHSPFIIIGHAQQEPPSATSITHMHADAISPFEGPAKSNSNNKQYDAPSNYRNLSYKRSLKRGRPTSETKISKTADSSSVGNEQSARAMETLDQPKGISNSSIVIPPDVEPNKDVERSLEKTACGFDSLVIEGRIKDVSPLKEKVPEIFGLSDEPELIEKSENSQDVVMKDAFEFMASETGQLKEREHDEGALSHHTKHSETRKLSSTSTSTCKGNINRESFAARSKKPVPRKNLSSKSKLTAVNPSKDNGVSTKDKSATPRKSDVESEKKEKLKAAVERGKAASNKKKGTDSNVCKDAVIDEKVQPKVNPLSESSIKKKSVVNTSKDNGVSTSNKSATPTKSEVESAKKEKLKAAVEHGKTASNKKKGTDSNVCKDAVIDEKAKPKVNPLSESSIRKKSVDPMELSMDPEKENMPKENGISASNSKKDCKNSRQGGKIFGVMKNNEDQTTPRAKVANLDPMWFILSGHRFQRKEFQAVIRRLRGRVCRDSHNWSYQATHFIVPDLVKRTEKFFAAAAAGRWILKSDYLTASSEAGKFLGEEPFEWYNNSLTEDGAINLEAPRKWRHLRERTGHGAFYKMRILIYGECIAPTLDTLKRVVKAGDGTILATSPPYTRFLNTNIDYAIVSPSMPRVDSWVQEFLRHEIPCVVADYLVEFVCKSNYPLDRHVLYNTHSWAEKSHTNLLSRSEEIVIEESVEDIECSVCGSRDRGDVMMICGDENGNVGCGVGMHIDCCDPPLDDVPEGDWFCSKCSRDAIKDSTKKGSKKKAKLNNK